MVILHGDFEPERMLWYEMLWYDILRRAIACHAWVCSGARLGGNAIARGLEKDPIGRRVCIAGLRSRGGVSLACVVHSKLDCPLLAPRPSTLHYRLHRHVNE